MGMIAGPVSVMASTFDERYRAHQEAERKKKDAEIQHKCMLQMASLRGKHAFWENLQTVLVGDGTGQNKNLSLPVYRRFISEMFRKFDVDKSGFMEFNEVKNAIIVMGVQLSDEQVHALLQEEDSDISVD